MQINKYWLRYLDRASIYTYIYFLEWVDISDRETISIFGAIRESSRILGIRIHGANLEKSEDMRIRIRAFWHRIPNPRPNTCWVYAEGIISYPYNGKEYDIRSISVINYIFISLKLQTYLMKKAQTYQKSTPLFFLIKSIKLDPSRDCFHLLLTCAKIFLQLLCSKKHLSFINIMLFFLFQSFREHLSAV